MNPPPNSRGCRNALLGVVLLVVVLVLAVLAFGAFSPVAALVHMLNELGAK